MCAVKTGVAALLPPPPYPGYNLGLFLFNPASGVFCFHNDEKPTQWVEQQWPRIASGEHDAPHVPQPTQWVEYQ